MKSPSDELLQVQQERDDARFEADDLRWELADTILRNEAADRTARYADEVITDLTGRNIISLLLKKSQKV